MLKGRVKIVPTLHGKNYKAHNHLRMCFLFGDDETGYRLTGSVKSQHPEYIQGNTYDVDVDFFTVTGEGYEQLKPLLKKGMRLVICEGRKIVGDANLIDYKYVG